MADSKAFLKVEWTGALKVGSWVGKKAARLAEHWAVMTESHWAGS